MANLTVDISYADQSKNTIELIAQMTSKENNFPSSFSSTKNPLKKTLSLLTVGINVANI